MDKYEYRVKTEQMLDNMEKHQYKKAMEVADTIDWRRVKNVSMLSTVSEIYELNGEFQKSRDILLTAFDRSPNSRKIVYRLGTLALKLNDTDAASDCYEEFVKLAPKDPNQYILKYKILRTQGAPLTEQIAALSDFKKAEYVEKWAYELAKLYHEAGMTAECLEECDDLILWFSEGKYVYQAMELKMKYKPLTPLQQEKYDEYKGVKAPGVRRPVPRQKKEFVPKPEARLVSDNTMKFTERPMSVEAEADDADAAENKGVSVDDILASLSGGQTEEEPNATRRLPTGELGAALAGMKEQRAPKRHDGNEAEASEEDEESIAGESEAEENIEENVEEIVEEFQQPPEAEVKKPAITTVVKGATLEEALMNGVAMANGINREEKKRMEQREEEIRISGQMKIEDILQEWEEKQKLNAEAIEEQKAKDEERLKKERIRLEKRREAERLEAERREAEEVARRRAEEAARKAAEEEAKRKAAEEAKRKAEEEAKRKAEEEAKRKAEEEAKRKAEEAKRKAEEEAKRKAEEEAKRKAEEEAKRKAAEEEAAKKAAEETAAKKDAVRKTVKKAAKKTQNNALLSDDIRQLVEELESRVSEEHEEKEPEEENELASLPAEIEATLEAYENEPDIEDAEEDEFEEDEFEEDEFEEDEFEEDEFEEDEFEEDEFDEDESEEDEFEEDEFEEDEFEEDEFEEDEFEEDEFEEDEFEEDEFEEDEFEEDEFEEAELEEDEFEEAELDEDEFEEDEFEEDEFEEDEFDELPEIAEPDRDVPLEIEEPSEEEIQKRIKKAKGKGVPFDTGFVVTGRYDLSATSEIGLKAGLTEEQKKLFSYFVPVRGMSEQIVEVLDNDRRARREGTSKTGNLLVLGRKGSGKTVLAVDIVKAIQKQRNLKQGKVAIVTGESLNKKELTNIIQKLRGGAIIVEKAGKLNSRTIKELNHLMEKSTGEMLFVLEDQRKPLERILTANPDFKKKFTSKLELPVFINDELVTFGQTYAKENGYKLDEMGILALYSRIDVMQREDHAVTVAEVKDIMDEAIEHSQKANVKHLARRMFGRGTDDSDRVILKEEDFKI